MTYVESFSIEDGKLRVNGDEFPFAVSREHPVSVTPSEHGAPGTLTLTLWVRPDK